MPSIPPIRAPATAPAVSRDDMPPSDAPKPPLVDYIDLSAAAREVMSGRDPPEAEAPLTYRGLSSIRLKAPVPLEPLAAPGEEP